MKISKDSRSILFETEGETITETYKLARNFTKGTVQLSCEADDAATLTLNVYVGNDLYRDSQKPVQVATDEIITNVSGSETLLVNLTSSFEYVIIESTATALASTADLEISMREVI